MNSLPNGTIALGAPGSIARELAEAQDCIKKLLKAANAALKTLDYFISIPTNIAAKDLLMEAINDGNVLLSDYYEPSEIEKSGIDTNIDKLMD